VRLFRFPRGQAAFGIDDRSLGPARHKPAPFGLRTARLGATFARISRRLAPNGFNFPKNRPSIASVNPEDRTLNQIFWILRIGVAMEFIGHGMLGVLHLAPAWTNYFAVVGISKNAALAWMPLVGAFDVTMALAVIFYPVRGVILWMAAWGLWTAILRPLAGESTWEVVERAGNYGTPLALFLLAKGGGAGSWLSFRLSEALDGARLNRYCWLLRLSTVLLLTGHGALNLLVRKPVFAVQYSMLGLHFPWAEPLVGGLECVLALAVLIRPAFGLLVGVFAWKLATEALSPMAGSPVWVFIEHGGSYAAPLVLALLVRRREQATHASVRLSPA
jgi:hypothetical protein